MTKYKRTNKTVLASGVKNLAAAIGALVLGPVMVYNAFMNKDHHFFIPVLIVGVFFMLLAIFLIIRGLKLMLDSFFKP